MTLAYVNYRFVTFLNYHTSVPVQCRVVHNVTRISHFSSLSVTLPLCSCKPEAPEEMKLTATAVSITVEWKRGFDGGPQQTFHLQCAGTEQRIPDHRPPGEDHYTVRLGEEDDIEGSEKYKVLLYAENSLGNSSVLQETVTTKGFTTVASCPCQ